MNRKERQDRNSEIIRWSLRGHRHEDIARQFGISRQAVDRVCRQLETERWVEKWQQRIRGDVAVISTMRLLSGEKLKTAEFIESVLWSAELAGVPDPAPPKPRGNGIVAYNAEK